MANNQYVNKVQYDGNTLIDLTADTAIAEDVAQGKYFHLATGERVQGTASSGPAGIIYITDTVDANGGTIRSMNTDGATITDTVDEHGGTVRSITGVEVYLQSKTVQPTESAQSVTPDTGYGALGAVNVGAIPSNYVGSGVTQRASSDLTASGATVTAPAGYYSSAASKSVASGTAGTPTASKGSVSNHSISVTPSVTNTAGYIDGGTKTGTAVSVSASELVSGTYTVSASGTHDVTDYASASVAAGSATASASKGAVSNHSVSITPSVTRTAGYISAGSANGTAVTVAASELVSGTKSITENGTGIDVTNYASVDVAVPGGATHAGTITVSGSSTGSYVQVNGTGTQYSADGATFSYKDGDYLKVYAGYGAVNGGYVVVDGTTVADGGANPATYNYTLPPYDIGVEFTRSVQAKVEITTPSLSITSNGTYDVEDYARANVNVQSGTLYTATISGSGNQNYCYAQVNSDGDRYYANGTSFTYSDSDEIRFGCSGSQGGGTITVNGVTVAQSTYSGVYYTLASPRADISVQMNYAVVSQIDITVPELSITSNGVYDVSQYARANVNVSGYTHIYSTTIEVSTSSTTAIAAGTVETDDSSIWTSDKLVYLKIRDTAGWRTSHYYGCDAYIANANPANAYVSTSLQLWYGTGYSMISDGRKIASNPILTRTAVGNALNGYGIYPVRLYPDGSIELNARYSTGTASDTQTIDGTFSVDVYTLDWPGGVSPFYETAST